jgi:hypothetical protein
VAEGGEGLGREGGLSRRPALAVPVTVEGRS